MELLDNVWEICYILMTVQSGLEPVCRLRDPLQNQLRPLPKLIQSSVGWKLHMRHCRLNYDSGFSVFGIQPSVNWFSISCWSTKVFSAVEQDAAGLTQLSSTVEDVFSSGDLPRAAETLANMRYCLTAVGEVSFSQLFVNSLSCLSWESGKLLWYMNWGWTGCRIC